MSKISHFFKSGRFTGGILMFAVVLISVLLFTAGSVYVGAFSSKSVNSAICNEDVYNALYEDTMKSEESFAIPNGLSNDVFDGVISPDRVKLDMMSYAENILGNTDHVFDTDFRRSKLIENVYAEMESNGVKITSELKKDIETFADECIAIYVSKAEIPYAQQYAKVRSMASIGLFAAVLVLLLFDVILLLILSKVSGYKHRTVRYMSYIFGAVGLVLSVVSISASRVVQRIQLQPENFKLIILSLCNTVVCSMLIIGVIMILLCVLFAFLSENMRKTLVKKIKNGHRAPAGFQQNLIDFIEDHDESGANWHVSHERSNKGDPPFKKFRQMYHDGNTDETSESSSDKQLVSVTMRKK